VIVKALDSVLVINFLNKFRLENCSFQNLCFKRITQYHQQLLSVFLWVLSSFLGEADIFYQKKKDYIICHH